MRLPSLKTIKDASKRVEVQQLITIPALDVLETKQFQAAFKEAFEATGVMDIYDGIPVVYMNVIIQTLGERLRKIKFLEKKIRIAHEALSVGV